ncbi:MAG: hypothetical protein ACK5O2_09175, partial [Microthrixaceae bacterium]
DDRLDEVEAALEDVRWPVQQVVNRQVRARRTPQIRFAPDAALNEAMRIDELLAGLPERSTDDSPDETTDDPSGIPSDDPVADSGPGVANPPNPQ